MRKKRPITNHNLLLGKLQTLRNEMATQEAQLTHDAKYIALSLPVQLLNKVTSPDKKKQPLIVGNPTGKLLNNVIAKRMLKKENFFVRFAAGLFLKNTGKKIERALFR